MDVYAFIKSSFSSRIVAQQTTRQPPTEDARGKSPNKGQGLANTTSSHAGWLGFTEGWTIAAVNEINGLVLIAWKLEILCSACKDISSMKIAGRAVVFF